MGRRFRVVICKVWNLSWLSRKVKVCRDYRGGRVGFRVVFSRRVGRR